MTIDTTGMLSWTPTVNDVGTVSPVIALTNSAGTVDVTIPITVTTFAGPPTSVNVLPTGQALPTVTWSPPVTAIGDPVAGYTITLTDLNNNNAVTQYTAGSTATSLGLPNLSASTFTVTVQAFDASGVLGLPTGAVSFSYDPNAPNPTYAFTSNGGAAYVVVGQPLTIQITDLNTANSQGETFSVASGPAGMVVDQYGLVTWTPGVGDIGYVFPVIAVTNSFGTTDVYVSAQVAFTTAVTNVNASGSLSTGLINVSWSPAASPAYDPIAGYYVLLTWTDSSGVVWSTGGETSITDPNPTAFSIQLWPQNVAYTVTVYALDAAGNFGAPSAGTTVILT